MYNRRINPQKQLVNQILEITDRIDSIENQPSGIIVSRESISAKDPNTGVSTVIGQLPDGSYGLAPYLYDIVAPPIATMPIVKTEPGAFIITWNGSLLDAIPNDFVRVNVIGHKMNGTTTVSSTAVGTLTSPLDICYVSTSIAIPGEVWQFSLESEDYNGNRATWGPRSASFTMLSFANDIEISQALIDATTAINDANAAATNALQSANSKNQNFYSATMPTGTNYAEGDIWYDTAHDYRPSRWNATTQTWVISLFGNDAIFGNLDIGKATIGFLNTDVVKAKSIGVDKLVITSTDNLIVGANFRDTVSWGPLGGFKTINQTAGRGGTPALRITGTILPQTINNLNNKIAVDADALFRGGIYVKSTSALPEGAVTLNAKCYTSATDYELITIAYNDLLIPNTWTAVGNISPNLPLETLDLEFFLEVTNSTSGTITDIDYVSITRASDGKLLVDGTVTASKLETSLVLTTSVIAGNPLGTHARMDGNGFRVFAADPIDGIPNEVVRMGVANTDDYFAITKADGTLAASISQDGVLSASGVYANNSLVYKGTEMTQLLKNRSGGVRSYGSVDLGGWGDSRNIKVGSNSWYGMVSDSIIMESNRVYRIVWQTPIWNFQSGGGELQVAFYLRGIAGNDTSQIDMSNSYIYKTFIRTMSSEGSWESDQFESTINTGEGEDGRRLQVLIAVWKGPTGAAGWIQWLGTSQLYIIDDGPRPGAATVILNAAGGSQYSAPPAPPPPPAVNTYVRQYGTFDSMNYTGGNGQYLYNLGQMYQGLSPAGYGNLKSIGLFDRNAILNDLSGASINYIRVYFNFNHWYYNGGGTARIGVHGHTGIPGSFGSVGPIVAVSGGWPKPGARWVDIPSWAWDGFKTGAYSGGVYLEGDGTYNTYGYADRPVLEISYTK